MKKLFIVLFLVITSYSSISQTSEQVRWKTHSENTKIIRDKFGVPHIYGKSDADAVFGLLYAHCEDDFNRIEQNYIWAIGRLAEVEGEKAIYSDLRAKMFMTIDEAKVYYENSPEWLKKLCVAFADGINYYLYKNPEVKPKLITRFEPWMPMYFSEGSIGGDIERISTQKIKNFYESDSTILLSAVYKSPMQPNDNEPRGSNGFAISGKLTASGNAMLLINPHTSFFFRGEAHVVSEEGLNAYGAVTWGQFFIYQGFNEKTGWMHTSSYADVMDEFIETIIKTDAEYKYVYGDELRLVKSIEISLKYKQEDQLKDKNFTIYRTHHGPITHSIGNKWVATAMMWDPVKALSQSYIRTKLNNHNEFREMMNIRTNSSNNTVYADADGNIAYYHGNFMPIRNVKYDYSKPIDGSNPETDWKGLHTVDEIITVFNPPNGWIQNCNSNPFTSADIYSPKVNDYPRYMSLDQENFRGIHAIRLLKNANKLNIDKLINLAYDPYLPAFEVLIPGLVVAYDQSNKPNQSIKEAINILRNWDFAVSKESVAMSLAHFYGLLYLQEGKYTDGLSVLERIEYFGISSPKQERLEIFEKTIAQLNSDFGSWNMPWGEINRYQRINGEINQPFNDKSTSIPIGMASGQWGALASFGARSYNNTKRIYGTSGNSFVAVVEFGKKVKAKSILVGGQSGNPDSPHFADQLQRYDEVIFKDVAYYKEDVERSAKQTYHPGEKKK
ncbi:MAG: acylase [Flavobacteriaceae bacterium]|nr:acylase [Flavobacteriaceae bacterium]